MGKPLGSIRPTGRFFSPGTDPQALWAETVRPCLPSCSEVDSILHHELLPLLCYTVTIAPKTKGPINHAWNPKDREQITLYSL